MKTSRLEQKLSKLRFPLLETEENLDVYETLAEVVQSNDTRYWEALPVLLANASREPDFNPQKVYDYLKDKKLKDYWSDLFLLALSLWEDQDVYVRSFKELVSKDKEKLIKLKGYLANNENFLLAGHRLSAQRLKDLFRNYCLTQSKEFRKAQSDQDALSLEYALSQVFSPKQKELVRKKLQGEKLTKTEREYYSRTVKKKALALANTELHHLAQRLVG